MDASSQFTGTIAGLNSSEPFNKIDLADIAFGSNTTVTYLASSADTGTLTVSDGTNTANIAILGQYSPADFHIASDGHGGTTVVDPVLSTSGSWSSLFSWPEVAVHEIVLSNGKILTYGTDQQGNQGAMFYDVWDPVTNTHNSLPNPLLVGDEFCSAGLIIPTTGQVLIAGGDARPSGSINNGVTNTNIFDPTTNSLTPAPTGPMTFARWYPTMITLDTGQLLILGGKDGAGVGVSSPEIYTPGVGWRTLTGANIAEFAQHPLYPRTWQASNGTVITVATDGSGNIYAINPTGNGQVSVIGQTPIAFNFNEPAIMFAPDRCLILGQDGSVWVMDISGPAPVFTRTGSLGTDRIWSNLTVLPDGRVMVSGGSAVDNQLTGVDYTVAIWDPSTGVWTSTGADAAVARLYHSNAVLLPDATILNLGGGAPGPLINLNGQIYTPGYLFDAGGVPAVRPVIQQAPIELRPGQKFTVRVDNPANIRTLALMPFGSSTHSFDVTARRIELPFSVQADGSLSAMLPNNSALVPPGDWMLFAIGNNGTPSIASTILVDPMLSLNDGTLVKAINVGGQQFTAANGITYLADPGPTTGASQVLSTGANIVGTNDDPLFNTERFAVGGGSYTYEIPVANGTYQVELIFAEIYSGITGPGQHVFDMSLEGQALPALQNIDIFGQVGANAPLVIDQTVTVTDGSLSIQVGPGGSSPGNVDNAKLDAFAVFSVSGASLAIAATAASKAEGNTGSTPFTFTVTRSGDTTGASSATYTVSVGSGANAANAADFTGGALPTGTVSFAPGQTSQLITINVAGDTTAEANESFTVTLSAPSAGTTIATAAAIGTIITDDGGALTLVKAINLGGQQFTAANGITYLADPGPTTGASGTLSTGADIVGTNDDPLYNTERFASGGGSYTYEIPVANGTYQVELNFAEIYPGNFATGKRVFDMSLEGQALPALQNIDIFGQVGANAPLVIDQTVTVTDGSLSIQVGPGWNSPGNVDNAKLDAFAVFSVSGGGGGGASLAIAAAAASKAEGNTGSTPFTFTVTRSGDTTGASSATYTVSGSGANPANAADFGGAFPTGTVSFAAGQTSQLVTINVAGDTTVEANEGFTVTLSAPSAGTTITTAAATGVILDDDGAGGGASLAIAATAASKAEGNTGSTPFTFTVTRSGDTTGASSATYTVSGSGANACQRCRLHRRRVADRDGQLRGRPDQPAHHHQRRRRHHGGGQRGLYCHAIGAERWNHHRHRCRNRHHTQRRRRRRRRVFGDRGDGCKQGRGQQRQDVVHVHGHPLGRHHRRIVCDLHRLRQRRQSCQRCRLHRRRVRDRDGQLRGRPDQQARYHQCRRRQNAGAQRELYCHAVGAERWNYHHHRCRNRYHNQRRRRRRRRFFGDRGDGCKQGRGQHRQYAVHLHGHPLGRHHRRIVCDLHRLRQRRQCCQRCRLHRRVDRDGQLRGRPDQPARHHQRRRRHHGGGQRGLYCHAVGAERWNHHRHRCRNRHHNQRRRRRRRLFFGDRGDGCKQDRGHHR